MTLADLVKDHENAVRAVETDPRRGLPLARDVLRRSRTGLRCFRIRCAGLVGNALGRLRRFPQAFRILRAAYAVASGCPCCLPVLDRHQALVLVWHGDYREALRLADRAVEGAPRDGLSLL